GLDGFCLRYVEERCQLADRHAIGGMHFCQWLFRLAISLGAHEFGLLAVGCIVAAIASHDIVFACFGQRDKFLRVFAANGSAISMDCDEAQAAAMENVVIGVTDLLVAEIKSVLISI